MSLPRRVATLGMVALLALQFLWHAWLLPPLHSPPLLVASLFALPIVPGVLLLLARRQSAVFWGGVAALFYFCHGVTEAWTVEEALPLALSEIALSLWIITAGSWEGMAARFSRRKGQPPNV